MFDSLKNFVRSIEARLTPWTTEIQFHGRSLRFHRSLWWVNETQYNFEEEILPYFAAIQRPVDEIKCIVDAGAATGLFAVAAAFEYPSADLRLFEPSRRQRILLARNFHLNEIHSPRAQVFETALWNRPASLTFRTVGAMSAIEATSHLAGQLTFNERVQAMTLDDWCEHHAPTRLDLLKMDIEGAEAEALIGARRSIERFRPELLIMAYHVRDGARTFERCASELVSCGYVVNEIPGVSGFLHAVHP